MSKITLAQVKSSTDKKENLRTAIELVEQAKAKGADLLVFPEFLMAYSPESQSAEELCRIAEGVDGEFISTLRNAAKTNDMSLVATIYEKSNSPERVFDTAVLIDGTGTVHGIYRKLHLYDALGFKESAKMTPGSDVTRPVSTPCGPVGMMICYDLRFPELSRILTLLGAEVLVAPSGWVKGDMKVEHWRTMITARAIENGCYVIAPDQVGNIYIGHSMIVDPFGRTIAEMEEREGLEVVDLDPTVVSEVREKLPLLNNRRKDIYSRYFIGS